ncbi:hypothetical protein ACFLYH_03030, partial [Candidatus Dependentiae bacterium]
MMKKILIGFFAASLLFCATGYAKKDYNDKNKSKISKEERSAKREEKRRKRLQKRREKRNKKKDEGGVWSRLFKKEQKQKKKQEKVGLAESKAAQNRYDKEMKQARKLEKKARYDRTRREKIRLADARRQMREYELSVAHKRDRATRETLMDSWENYRNNEVAKDYSEGKYSDLYRQPAWPFYMLYTEDGNKDLFQVNISTKCATDSYDSDGSSRDVTALTFGERPIQWQDLLVALRLDKKGMLASQQAVSSPGATTFANGVLVYNDANARDLEKVAWSLSKYYLADKDILFLGEINQLSASFNFFRYIKDKDLAIGFEVPFGYKSHRLKLDSNINSHFTLENNVMFVERQVVPVVPLLDIQVVQATQSAATYGTAINVLEKTMIPETLNYLLAPKGLSYLPKTSITGIGDVSTFMNYYIRTKYLERFLVGTRVTWPTAKDASTSKVWAPQLGSGFTKLSAYTSMLFNHQRKYFNPHMFIQASWNLPGHKKTRVPKIISYDGVNPAAGEVVGADKMAHGERVEYVANRAFTEYDTQI